MVIEPAQYWHSAEIKPSQEIVFIGVRLDGPRLTALLESALLTAVEMAQGEEVWLSYPDPLPQWSVAHSHHV